MSAYTTDRNESFFTTPGPLWEEGTVVGPTRPSIQFGQVGKKIRSLMSRPNRTNRSSSTR